MEKTPKGWYAAKIPKKAVTGTSLRFYVEGRNDKGKAIVSNGRVDSPNVMLIREKEAAETEKEMGGTKRTQGREPARRAGSDAAAPLPGPHRQVEDRPRHALRQPPVVDRLLDRQRLRLCAGRRPRGAARSSQSRYVSGVAWEGGGHLAPEIGYQLGPNFAISLEGRNQYIPQTVALLAVRGDRRPGGALEALRRTPSSRAAASSATSRPAAARDSA